LDYDKTNIKEEKLFYLNAQNERSSE